MSICSTAAPDPKPQGRRILDAKWDGFDSFTIEEVAKILRISTWGAYQAAEKGEIPNVRIGRRRIVSRAWLERFLGGE
jgi:excisionase family DNA binding protein